jgi:hypothetical protein
LRSLSTDDSLQTSDDLFIGRPAPQVHRASKSPNLAIGLPEQVAQ